MFEQHEIISRVTKSILRAYQQSPAVAEPPASILTSQDKWERLTLDEKRQK